MARSNAYVAVVAMMAVLFSTGQVAAPYGPEEIGAEESPIVDPDESGPELEQVEALLFAGGLIALRRLRGAQFPI